MIYLDHAATTPVDPEVLEAMLPFFKDSYGNPSSSYDLGYKARQAINNARKQIAALMDINPGRIFFTSGGTESDNWALCGIAASLCQKGRHIITSSIEHHAVLHTLDYLETLGFSVTKLPVDENGLIHPHDLEAAIRPDTILISIMFANNEIGTIQPIKQLSEIAHRHHILFHTDAVQAFGQFPFSASELGIDLLSASSHKIYGPKGCGCLYVKEGVPISPLIYGGSQENGFRSGTENTPGIVGFGKAAEIAKKEMEQNMQHKEMLRDYLIDSIFKEIPYCRLNGDAKLRLPGNVNFSFSYIEAASLLIMLDMEGICASTGSACNAGSNTPSHVLQALGLSYEQIKGSLRLTLGKRTTKDEIDHTVSVLKHSVERLRMLSDDYARISTFPT